MEYFRARFFRCRYKTWKGIGQKFKQHYECPLPNFLVHLSRRLKCTIVIMRCPSSVCLSVCPSVVCPSLTFHIFDFFSETTEQNSTKLDRKQELNVLYQVCVFRADQKKQHGRPGLWLAVTFSTSPLKPLNGIQRNLTASKISMSSTKFVFFGPIEKTRWPPLPLIGWDIFDFSSETVERNSTKLDRKQDLNVLYLVCVFLADRKNKMAALASDGWDILDFSFETAEQNSTKLDRKQDLNVLYQVCVFRADRKNKMATLASDWLRHFRLLFWNRWTEFNETL